MEAFSGTHPGDVFARPGRLSRPQVLATVREFGQAPGVPAILPYSRRYLFVHGEELDGIPVTVGWGDRDRLLVERQAERAKAALPAARHVNLAGCGHVPMSDDPQRVAALILDDSAAPRYLGSSTASNVASR